MAVKMSSADEALIAKYKQDWANAATQAERDAAHANAEAVRAGYGYSGGADGSGHIATGQSNAQSNAGTVKASKPSGFSGSAAGVAVNTDDQQAVKDAMNANSQAWWTAHAAGDQSEMDRLHAENEYYGSLLGGSVGYDAASGTWSGEAEAAPVKQKMAAATPDLDLTGMVVDHSSYLEQLYAAKKAKALAELQAAYEQNVNAINRAEQGLEEQYQNARNQAAGASELAKRNFAQYAAANGLNSGAGGQAELARNVALQNGMNGINTTEAQSIADIQLQRANAETNYNNAIAQAEAEGNYQLAAALYQEKVRVDEELLNLAITQYQLEYQAYRDSVADSQWQQSFDQGVAQQNWSNNFAQTQYNNALLQQEWENTLAKLKYDAGLKDNTEMTLSVAAAMAEYGQFTDESLAVFYKNGFTEDYLKAKYGYQPPSEANSEAYTAVDNTLLSMVKSGANMTELRAALRDALVDGMVTQEQYEQLCATYTPGWRT